MLKNSHKANREVVTKDVEALEEHTGNIYQTINILEKRANQINLHLKEEMKRRFDEFQTFHQQDLQAEEVNQNDEQIEVSKYYERLPKPTALAIEELESDHLFFKNRYQERDSE